MIPRRQRAPQSGPTLWRCALWLAALLLPLLPTLSALATERWQSDDYLIRSFFEIAMKREYGHERQVHFSRWQQPIRLKLINEFGDKPLQAEVVRIQSQHLARITGHPIQLVDSNPNLTLIMTKRQLMANWASRTINQDDGLKQALKEGICLANFATNGRYEITRATIIIPVDYSRDRGRFLDCVVEELTQTMGLPNDSDKVFPSIFNDHSVDRFPTGLDYVLLKLAYHPALHAGMSADEVRAALPIALKTLRANGDIAQADRRVLTESLRRWAGL